MNACVGCGHELSDDARFCSQCGLPVAATIRGRDLLDHQGADGWLLAPSSVARTPQRRGVLGRVAIGLLVLAIGFVAYLLYRSPATPIEEATDGLITPSTVTALTSAPTSSGDAGSDEATAPSAPAGVDEAGDARNSPEVDLTGLEPLAGHYVIAAGPGRFARIDLDRGEVEVFDAPGRIVGHFDGDLIVLVDTASLVGVSVEDPSQVRTVAELPTIEGTDSLVTAVFASDQGMVDLLYFHFDEDSGPRQSAVRVDLANRDLQVVELLGEGFVGFGLVPASGGGLFEMTGDGGYRYLVDGRVMAMGSRHILVEDCQTPEDCRQFWFDRESGREVDRPIPDTQHFAVVVGEAGRVVMTQYDTDNRRFIDVIRNRLVPPEFEVLESSDLFQVNPSVSPDGRYLLGAGDGPGNTLLFYDLDGEQLIEVPLDINGRLDKTLIMVKDR